MAFNLNVCGSYRGNVLRDTTVALSSWYIINNLRTKTPNIDPILAKIYFDTYSIPIGENIEDLKEASNEYEPDIIRFFLLNQKQRCDTIINLARVIFKGNIILPIQCKPFFEEMLSLNENMGQQNLRTKETQVLDSLRDTIIANSLENLHRTNDNCVLGRVTIPEPIPIPTSGKYILTDDEKNAYLCILSRALDTLYLPMFSGSTTLKVYGLTDIYEDSGTRFAKVIEYIKSVLFMICISNNDRVYYNGAGNIVPSLQDDMFTMIHRRASQCMELKDVFHLISRECSKYGSLTMAQAICLPVNTVANLDCFKLVKRATSPTYQFLVCQAYLDRLSKYYQSDSIV